ncbi:MAG: pantetheine-phosphate adenylyltransferase [Bryobacteraceae bacterium]|jgi:pantetheine-phosphate adenylyltransferase
MPDAPQVPASAHLVAIYPGSFDPLTNGHLDLISRGSRLFERLIVSILNNTQKQPLFELEERIQTIREATANLSNVEVDSFQGLLVDYASQRGANAILRGIRAISDYEAELQMALMNRRMRPETETIFLMAGEEYSFISSRMVKEIIMLGGDVSTFVPEAIASRIRAKFRGKG